MMEFRVILIESEEGFAASCPALRGCHSQGRTKEEALANIRSAIQEWLEVEEIEKSSLNVNDIDLQTPYSKYTTI